MEQIREVKKSFCALSVAYIVLGLALLIWPDISMQTFCYVFGAGMIISAAFILSCILPKTNYRALCRWIWCRGSLGSQRARIYC